MIQARADHFQRITSPQRARDLFKQSVRQVEIETHSFCNRVCWFCPNSKIDRRSHNVRMSELLYRSILAELASIDYDQAITYSRYNEPLADRDILARLRQARAALPRSHLFTHSNGDYLTRDYLDDLAKAGLNELRVQVYLGNDDRFDPDKAQQRMLQRLADLGLPFETLDHAHGFAARVQYEPVDVIFETHDFEAMGLDRGQTLAIRTDYRRTSPCMVVFHSIYIDYTGAVVPCCNIRSDEPSHADYVVGDLSKGQSIFDAYANSALVDWRRSLFRFGEKADPCRTCSYALISDEFDRDASAFGLP